MEIKNLTTNDVLNTTSDIPKEINFEYNQIRDTSDGIVLNLFSETDYENFYLLRQLLLILGDLGKAVSEMNTITKDYYELVVDPLIKAYTDEKNLKNLGIPTKRCYLNAAAYISSNLPCDGKNTYNINDAISATFAEFYKFPKNLSPTTDTYITLEENITYLFEEQMKAFAKSITGKAEEFVKKIAAKFPDLVGISIPPKKGKGSSYLIPETFWKALKKGIEDIPDHTDIKDEVSNIVGDSCYGLAEAGKYCKEKATEIAVNLDKAENKDITSFKSIILQDVMRQFGDNPEEYRPEIEKLIDLYILCYIKYKDVPKDQMVNSMTQPVCNSIGKAGLAVTDVMLEKTQDACDKIDEKIDNIFDIAEKHCTSFSKQFDLLLAPITPPTDPPACVKYLTNFAKGFNKHLIEGTEFIIDLVVHLIPIVQLLNKKITSKTSIFMDCAPTFLPYISNPIGAIPVALNHYIDKNKISFDLSKIKFTTNPQEVVGSVQDTIGSVIKAGTLEGKLEKTKTELIKEIFYSPPENYCTTCLKSIYKKYRFTTLNDRDLYMEMTSSCYNEKVLLSIINDIDMKDIKGIERNQITGICEQCAVKLATQSKQQFKYFTKIFYDENYIDSTDLTFYTICNDCNKLLPISKFSYEIDNKHFYVNYLCSGCYLKKHPKKKK